ncbi:MAG: SpoIIE family protein phosphatase [Actinobacteria bacterium]|nr:SpoIIE family protein phosphatase [Actinomycetota bacterium]
MPGTARNDDRPGRLAGDASVVRDAFDQLPMMVVALDGPDHRLAAANAAYRAVTGRSGVTGAPYRETFPELAGQQFYEVLDRVYATGQPETGTEWRAQVDLGSRGRQEVYTDFTVVPRRAADGTVNGLLLVATDVTDRVTRRRQDAAAARLDPAAPEIVAELQEALLPTALPALPRARIAARYLVAGQEQAAGGDWFDAIPLAGGAVALAVGDVVGHGVAASAAMGQLRAVLAELLAAEPDLGRVLERTDAYATRTPALRAATLALAVLDPADGTLRYTTCGHPPPLVIQADGTARFLAGTGTGPLGTGSPSVLGAATLDPGGLILLYSDGLVERPNRTLAEGMAELAAVAADAAGHRMLTLGAAPDAAERVCELTVELLTRTGYADDITTLAAQRLAEPVPALHLELPGERAGLTAARTAFAGWLRRLDAAAEDAEALHLAMVEVVTNAIEHAYPEGAPGPVELAAMLEDDGYVQCQVTDHGTWRRPDPADADRGHGLMVAGHVLDSLQVSRANGTTVTLRHRLRRPAVLASGPPGSRAVGYPGAFPAEPAFAVDAILGADGTALVEVCGPVNIITADQLARRLLSASRGGTVALVADLTAVTQLASAGVDALYRVKQRLAAHGQELALVTAAGSAAEMVLDLVRLGHRTPGR